MYYTDHSIEHSLRILEYLSQVITDLMSSEEQLNKYELFVLISSVYLHDIGMQFDKFELLNDYDLEYKVEDCGDESVKLQFIRKKHHIISKAWIIESINNNPEFRKIYFGDTALGEILDIISELVY